MADKLIHEITLGLKKDLYNLVDAIMFLKKTAHPYAKKDKILCEAINRMNKILGVEETECL